MRHPPQRGVGDGVGDSRGDSPVGQAEDGEFSAAGELVQLVHEAGALWIAPRAGDVVGNDVEAGADKIRRKSAAHVAEADEADRRHRQPSFCSSDRTARSDRLAETPAGAPQ